ncbi:MAG: DUF502 domain-containing protein [Rhodospirillales bacterium]|nr:DUF502 domain-containing protein [Rhodospirillales bacterium]
MENPPRDPKTMSRSAEDVDAETQAGQKTQHTLGFGQRLRAYFLTGILITAPLFITGYLAWLFIGFVDAKVTPLLPEQYNPESYLPFGVPGLGLIILFIFLTIVGAVTAGFFGKLWLRFTERLLNRMPIVRNIYSAVKQILETVLAQQSSAFREAVLVEYPRRGLWAIAFITGRTEGEVQNVTEEECINIFLPTTPNPTSGFLLFVPKKDLISLSMSTEEAIKMVISGGIITPPDLRTQKQKNTIMTSAHVYEDLEVLREADRIPILIQKEQRPNDRQDVVNKGTEDG